jgi:hypothetical protein
MNLKLKVTRGKIITLRGKEISQHELEIEFLQRTKMGFECFLALFVNISVEQFSKEILHKYNSADSLTIQGMILKCAQNSLLQQMRTFSQAKEIASEHVLNHLLMEASEHPKS